MSQIIVDRLERQFGDFKAVNGISFEVQKGEIFGFLGPNGAGKTTTLKMLSTILSPTAGRASVEGHDILTDRTRVRQAIGMIFQDPSLDDRLTAYENLWFHAMVYKVSETEREGRIRDALALVELSDRARILVRTFSGGMKRRLEIARGLIHQPAVLFLDEPTVGLDPQTRRRIWEFLKTLNRERQITLFLTTHYMEEAEVCDRIAIIDHGKIVALDKPDVLKAKVAQDVIVMESPEPDQLIQELKTFFKMAPQRIEDTIQLEVAQGDRFLVEMIQKIKTPLRRINLRKPTLEDVFIQLTGHDIRKDEADDKDNLRAFARRRGIR